MGRNCNDPGRILRDSKELKMKTCYILAAWLVLVPFFLQAQPEPAFEDIFMDKTMRIDYFHIGDANSEIVTVDHIYQYGIWAGSRVKLIDRFNNGLYYVKIFDPESGRLVYSRGFNSYFGEYQTSRPAAEGIKMTYHESALIPCPRKIIRFSLEKRDRKNKLHEIFSSSVAYNEFYPKGIEPLEPNITAFSDPGNLKWKDLLDKDIALPTPWEKAAYDELDYAWQKQRAKMNDRIAELKRTGAPAEEINKAEQEYSRKDREHSQKVDEFLAKSRYRGKVGVYEGAGYSSQGLYRPMVDCIMFSKGSKPFCKVCEASIRKVIQHYLE